MLEHYFENRKKKLGFSLLRICTSPPPPLSFDPVFMDDGECAVWYGKNYEKILQFIFFELWVKIWVNWSTKVTITRKIKIGNLVFLSIQPILDLSCKFEKLKNN